MATKSMVSFSNRKTRHKDGESESESRNSHRSGLGIGIWNILSTPMTILGHLTSLSLVLADNTNMTATSIPFDDIIDGNNFSATTSTLSGNTTVAPAGGLPHPLWLTIILGFLAGIVMVITILGNITVLLAFGLERTIRQPTNYFLASLAVSDLLIGTFSMPLYTQYLLFGVWPLGQWLCDLWLSLDWTLSLTSQYSAFLITMDRFLSVKIPAKYRNWRTERKVLVMISITWIVPAAVFFTSIIGWQFFVGERTVKEGTCEVQFMNDAMFTFLLTIGYFWITLFVIGILYSGIYKVALDLQRKSDAKHKRLQSTMELAAGDGPNHNNDRDSAIGGHGGGSNNNSSGGDSQNQSQKGNSKSSKANTRKSVRNALPCPVGIPAVNTTSFTNKADKDDDRSSSPTFASDDENSSSGGACGAPKSPLSSGVYIGRPNPSAGIVNSALFANTGGLVRSLHGDLFFGGSGPINKTEKRNLITAPPPAYSEIFGKSSSSEKFPSDVKDLSKSGKQSHDNDEIDDGGLYSPALEKQTTPLLQEEINKGCRYIDEDNFIQNLSTENTALLPDISKDASEIEDNDVNESRDLSSPVWKRRHSLPLPSGDQYDEYDLDDEVSGYITGDPTTTVTVMNDTPEIARHECSTDNAGGDISMNNVSAKELNSTQHVGSNGAQMCDLDAPKSNSYNAIASASIPQSTSGENDNTIQCSNIENMNDGNTSSTAKNNITFSEANASSAPCNNNTNITPSAPLSDGNEDSSRSDTHCLSAAHRRRNNKDTRLHTFVKSVRSRNSRRRNRRERKSKSENRARKALRTITIILGAFVLCWTPYHICVMVKALCKYCVNDYVYSFTYWMCYLNSPINPFCYAFANAQFKRTFIRIIRFDLHRT